MTPKEKALENFVGKGENAGKQHFLLFQQCFLPFPNEIQISDSQLFVIKMEQLEILSFG